MKKKYFIPLFAFLLAAPFVFILKPNSVEAQFGDMPAIEVLALKIKQSEIEITKESLGRVSAFKIAQVRPQVSGVIASQNFVEGSFVEKNQQLYQIDDATFLADLQNAKASLAISQANLVAAEAKIKRSKELVKVEAISKQEFDEIKAQFESAQADVMMKKADVKNAQIRLEYSKVLAPISGKIGKSYFTQGALVAASQADPLAIITQLNPIYVDMNLASNELFELKEKLQNREAKVQIMIGDDEKIYDEIGRLQFYESIVDESTNSVSLRAIFDNKNESLLPNLFVKAKIFLGTKKVIKIPQSAASINPEGGINIFVIDENNVINPKKLTDIKNFGNFWIVENGLKAGEMIVLEGFQKIKAGQKVKPVFANEEKVKETSEASVGDAKNPVLQENISAKQQQENDETVAKIEDEIIEIKKIVEQEEVSKSSECSKKSCEKEAKIVNKTEKKENISTKKSEEEIAKNLAVAEFEGDEEKMKKYRQEIAKFIEERIAGTKRKFEELSKSENGEALLEIENIAKPEVSEAVKAKSEDNRS